MKSRRSSTSCARCISRVDAARLLRKARRLRCAPPDEAGEAIGWAFSAMRESIHARKLKIDHLVSLGQFDSADAIIARSLMQGQDHPLMRLRFAESLHAQGRIGQAEIEAARVLRARPQHCRALALAARIATDQGRPARAVSLLVMACDERPHDARLRAALIQAFLDTGLIGFAVAQLAVFDTAPTALRGRVLRAQGRTLDAIELLEREMAFNVDPAVHNEMLHELIDCLEHIGDGPRLRALLPLLTDARPQTQLRAAQALLAFGDFSTAKALAQPLASHAQFRRRAVEVLCVASELDQPLQSGSSDSAGDVGDDAVRGSLNQWAAVLLSFDRRDPRTVASHWLRGMLGQALCSQVNARAISGDPSMSILQPLLQQSVQTFEAVLAGDDLEAADRAALQKHCAECLLAMGRDQRLLTERVHPQLPPADSGVLRPVEALKHAA